MKKIGLLCLALVLALGTMGVGLAQWTETLTITGNANTGNLSVTYQNVSTSDNENSPDVATCEALVSGGADNQTLTITITNGYPCYTCTVDFEVKNDGSIPVDLGGIMLSSSDIDVSATVGVNDCDTQNMAVNGTDAGQIVIHIEDGAAEDTTYTAVISGTILAEQFNMP